MTPAKCEHAARYVARSINPAQTRSASQSSIQVRIFPASRPSAIRAPDDEVHIVSEAGAPGTRYLGQYVRLLPQTRGDAHQSSRPGPRRVAARRCLLAPPTSGLAERAIVEHPTWPQASTCCSPLAPHPSEVQRCRTCPPLGPRARSLGITAAVTCVTLLIVVAIISSTGGPASEARPNHRWSLQRAVRTPTSSPRRASRKLGPGSRGRPPG